MADILIGLTFKFIVACLTVGCVFVFRSWQQNFLIRRFWVMLAMDAVIIALISRYLAHFSDPLEHFAQTILPTSRHLLSFSLLVALILFLIILGLEARVMLRKHTIIKNCAFVAALASTIIFYKNSGMDNVSIWKTFHIPFMIYLDIMFFPSLALPNKTPEMDGEFEHKFVNVNGIRTHYVTEGEGQPVILIHGLPETYYSWRKVIKPLAENFKVYSIDTIGHGFTDKPATGYTVKELTDHVLGFIEALNMEKPVVVGHDWGGYIAWEIGVFHPERLKSLVVINAPLHKNRHAIHHRLLRIPGVYEFIGVFSSNSFLERIFESSCYKNLDQFNLKEYIYIKNLFNIRGTYHASAQIFHSLYSQREHLKKRKELGVNVPTLYIWAEKDPRQPRELFEEEVKPYVRDLTFKSVPDSGHFLQSEKPEILVEYLKEYIGGQCEKA